MPTKTGKLEMEDTQAIAEVLFMQFCKERFQKEGIDESPVYEELYNDETIKTINIRISEDFGGYSNPLLTTLGSDLRKIAESFENSKEREKIRETVGEMDLSTVTLTYDHFKTILTELFTNGGITREKVVILFFFCSDLAVKAYNNSYVSYCITLLSWSLRFIFDFVCDWVQSRGGWEHVLNNYVPKLLFTTAGVLSCVALAVYIKRNI